VDDPDAELRAAAVRWFDWARRVGRFNDDLANQWDPVKQKLISLLDDVDPDVQLEAAHCLATLDSELPRVGDVVCKLIARDGTQTTTLARLARLCGSLRSIVNHTLPVLGTWLSSNSAELREAAATALSQLGRQAAPLEAQLAVALEDEEPIVREFAAVTLGRLWDLSESSRAALLTACDDEDAGVSKIARLAVDGELRDP
jgi:HEAT repeat protein